MNAIKNYLQDVKESIGEHLILNWNYAGDLLLAAYHSNNNVWIAGNGGNLANSLHFATDWTKGLYLETGKPLNARSLSENQSTNSAFANDLGFEGQFANQLKMSGQANDVVVLLTAGGSSQNIIKAAIQARELGMKSIGLTGGSGLEISHLFDVHLHISSTNIQLVEDIHAIFGHAMFKHILENFAN
jgi:phosphoheptose isomerase